MTDDKQEIRALKDAGKLLEGHKGDEFYYSAWAKKAKQRKRSRRKQARTSRRKNR